LQQIYNELIDENEKSIIKQYAIYAKRYTIAIICKTTVFDFLNVNYIYFSN